MAFDPVTLQGRHVRLEPMAEAHIPGLQAAAAYPEIWGWTWPGTDPEVVAEWVRTAIANQRAGTDLAFATIDAASGEIAGSSRFMAIEPAHRRVEIGNTWLAPAWQRTAFNTEAKYLMMRHAFEQQGCIRVEFKTHARNSASRKALLRIGAKPEGIHRQHMVMADGSLRDSAWYSVLDHEWPEVKAMLETRLAAGRNTP